MFTYSVIIIENKINLCSSARLVVFEKCKLGDGGHERPQLVVYAGEINHRLARQKKWLLPFLLGNCCSPDLTVAVIGR